LFGCAWQQSESIREVVRRVAKNSKGASGFLCVDGWSCADQPQPV